MNDDDVIPETEPPVIETPTPAPVVDVPSATAWQGDNNYFQTGKKAGKPKPAPQPKKSGLDFEGLKFTGNGTPSTQPAPVDSQKEQAAEKKGADARVAAKLVMRALDMIVGFIGGGQYGKDFTSTQTKDRNVYRDELDKSWAEYLATLDVAMHPALVAIVGSIIYVAPAFETARGQERVNTLSEKLFGKLGAAFLRRKK